MSRFLVKVRAKAPWKPIAGRFQYIKGPVNILCTRKEGWVDISKPIKWDSSDD